MLRMKIITSALLIAFTCGMAYAKEIALTFDDLPAQEDVSAQEQKEINDRILNSLQSFNAPAIGFVNESKLANKGETSEKIAILKSWIDKRQCLGNHTYSHNALSTTDLDDFQNDVIKGAMISKELMHNAGLSYRYFRHPYLDTGGSKEKRDLFDKFLKIQGYVIAPATIDTDDWKFNRELHKNPNAKKQIIQNYLEHTKRKFRFYEHASHKMFGRNIKHVWLLHANLINSIAMDDLLKLASEFGYKFVSLDAVLNDNAYSEPDYYYDAFGVSWLYRWDYTRGKIIDWSQEPEPNLS